MGYVQQDDLHLPTSTVREALRYSALLRQPREISQAEKLAYVETVISMLDMEPYAEGIVGIPGKGASHCQLVAQRQYLRRKVSMWNSANDLPLRLNWWRNRIYFSF